MRQRGKWLGLGVIASVVAFAWFLWQGAEQERDGLVPARDAGDRNEPSADAFTPAPESTQSAGIDASRPASGGMAAILRETNEANRHHILWLTITDAGFECDEVISSGTVGNSGALWRVRCSDAQVYSAEVDVYGQLEITPTPYGDIDINTLPRITAPDSNRAPELPNQR